MTFLILWSIIFCELVILILISFIEPIKINYTSKKLNLIGKAFGRLFVLNQIGLNKKNKAVWDCVCDCGNHAFVISNHLVSGHVKSCGCLRSDLITDKNMKHGHSKSGEHSPEFTTWQNIKNRCYNRKNSHYKYYGGRGIRMCDRWLTSFDNFFNDMGNRPSTNHSIDRIDNNGNYNAMNCRWATKEIQARNKNNNNKITLFGENKTLAEWAGILKCTRFKILYHLAKGKSSLEIETILKKSKMKRKNPTTSNEAWKSITHEQLNDTYKKIIAALNELGEGTFEDIAVYLKVDKSRVWKRMSEMERMELVYRPGKKRKLKSGRNGFTWMLCNGALKKVETQSINPKQTTVSNKKQIEFLFL